MAALTCPACGLVLPSAARFCARCGRPLVPGAGPAPAAAPVWVLALLWIGMAGFTGLALGYGLVATGLVRFDPAVTGSNPATVRATAAVIAVCALSLSLAHLASAVGLMTGRPWSRPLATMTCGLWMLSCVGLPVGLLAISAMWRAVPGRERFRARR